MCSQFIGAAVFLAVSNSIFNQRLGEELATHAPNVNPAVVLSAGATNFRHLLGGEDLPGVIQAYANSLGYVYYLACAVCACSILTVWGMGWVDIREKKKIPPATA
jgi:hypothetical protein